MLLPLLLWGGLSASQRTCLNGAPHSYTLPTPTGKNAINIGLAAGNAAAGAAFIGSGATDAATGVAALCECRRLCDAMPFGEPLPLLVTMAPDDAGFVLVLPALTRLLILATPCVLL